MRGTNTGDEITRQEWNTEEIAHRQSAIPPPGRFKGNLPAGATASTDSFFLFPGSPVSIFIAMQPATILHPHYPALMAKAHARHPGMDISPLGVTEYGGESLLWYHAGEDRSTRIVKIENQAPVVKEHALYITLAPKQKQ